MQENPRVKITRVMNAQAVGTTTVNGSEIDMQNFEGVLFILFGGTVTDGDLGLKAQQDTVTGMGSAADLAGTLTEILNADDNKIAVLDIHLPRERFVRGVAVRGGATGAVIDGMVAVQYGVRKKPTTHDVTTVAASTSVVSPAEGTP